MFSPKCSLASVLIASVFCCQPVSCLGQAVLWDQQPDTSITTVIDLEIAEPFAAFSTYQLNDATFTSGVVVSEVTTYFSNTSGVWTSDTIFEARLCIFPFDFTPFDPSIDGEVVPVTVTNLGNGVLAVTASKLSIQLGAGSYWFGLTPVLDPSTLAQEFRFDSGNTVGGMSVFRNPLNGFGLGAGWMPTDALVPGFGDAALTLRGAPNLLGFDTTFPESATVVRGFQISGELEEVCFDDGQRWIFNPGFVLNSEEAPVWIEFEGQSPFIITGRQTVEVLFESQASTPGLTLTVEEFNFSTNVYEVIGEESESVGVDVQRFFPSSTTGAEEVRIRAGWRQTGITTNFPWEVRIDTMSWNRI